MTGQEHQQKATRVAIIDDDASLCRALSRLLTAVGIQPKTYSSAEAFLADEEASDPGCLLLDVELQGMSGLELQQRLSTDDRRIPIIFITAHVEPSVRALAERGGCTAFLSKTDPGKTVIEAVRHAINPAAPAQLHSTAR